MISCLALDKNCKEELIVKVNIGFTQKSFCFGVKPFFGDLWYMYVYLYQISYYM